MFENIRPYAFFHKIAHQRFSTILLHTGMPSSLISQLKQIIRNADYQLRHDPTKVGSCKRKIMVFIIENKFHSFKISKLCYHNLLIIITQNKCVIN